MLPALHGAHERYEAELTAYYEGLSQRVERFLTGLAVWDGLAAGRRSDLASELGRLPMRAVRRYQEHLRSLATQFPEVELWMSAREFEATRGAVRELEPSLIRLERSLANLTLGSVPDEQAQSLERAYRAALGHPIAESGEVPTNLTVPTLERAYLPPLFRVAEAGPDAAANNEGWWEGIAAEDGIEEFFIRYFTSVQATVLPMLVMGQPGAGKSVLTRVLAARLSSASFLVVRVPLRDVAGELDLQSQIELAIHQHTGERVTWPALVRSWPDAQPVVLVDGFDELLQATGVRQTDYLTRIADFQRRESEQGRPVAVVVTTRTSVADRARPPAGTVMIRLDPFDRNRIESWIDIWNASNAAGFRRSGLRPMTADAVMRHEEIAAQPLLLLMLALYDAEHNALRQLGADLQQTDLYEQLLLSFARREIAKHRPALDPADLNDAAEQEMRRLSVVAFAIFNRASQWVTEADLDSDFAAIFPHSSTPAQRGLRSPLRPAELALGRFFFVHRAQARRDASTLHTYEFLHPTFGEFLVARLAWQVTRDTAARDRMSTLPTGGVDDELMRALLSFAPLTARQPIMDFLIAMINKEPETNRTAVGRVLVRQLTEAGMPRASRTFDSYAPRALTVSARYAAYSANLVLLAVAVKGQLAMSEVHPDADTDPAEEWHSLATLWQSQFNVDLHSITQAVFVRRAWTEDRRDVVATIDDGATVPPPIDPLWTYGITNQRGNFIWSYTDRLAMLRRVNLLCGTSTDLMLHHLEPLMEVLGRYSVTRFYSIFDEAHDTAMSATRALLDAWLARADNSASRRDEVYVRCALLCTRDESSWAPKDDADPHRVATLLLSSLAADPLVSVDTATAVLELYLQSKMSMTKLAAPIADCVLGFLGRGQPIGDSHRRLIDVLSRVAGDAVVARVTRQVGAHIAALTPEPSES